MQCTREPAGARPRVQSLKQVVVGRLQGFAKVRSRERRRARRRDLTLGLTMKVVASSETVEVKGDCAVLGGCWTSPRSDWTGYASRSTPARENSGIRSGTAEPVAAAGLPVNDSATDRALRRCDGAHARQPRSRERHVAPSCWDGVASGHERTKVAVVQGVKLAQPCRVGRRLLQRVRIMLSFEGTHSADHRLASHPLYSTT